MTGFGLVGHLLELCDGAGLTATLNWDDLPILPSALEYAKQGYNTVLPIETGSFGKNITTPETMEQWQKNMLTDPQTSGGLMVSCPPERADEITLFHAQGYSLAKQIDQWRPGRPT